MKFKFKKITAFLLIALLATAFLTGISESKTSYAVSSKKSTLTDNTQIPKYVFLFIGDGMSYPQIQASSDYLGALSQKPDAKILSGPVKLNFMNFPTVGSAITYDSTSFCPDSAATATAISTGHKTYSGVLSMDETKTKSYETIAEKLKKQLDYKIGIITSVTLNHATPAAFYAHQPSRSNYYEIGLELIQSNFDYFAGGELRNPIGNNKNKPQDNLYELAKKAGYQIITSQQEAKKLTSTSKKSIVISEHIADGGAMPYTIDQSDNEWKLKDYVEKGIEVLDNPNGFFMMVEGGKIDWACHANDAASVISDTIALSEAVDKALTFYEKHPEETLILVTGDHETGGLTIGFAGTKYDTFLTNLSNQKISYAKFDHDYVSSYKQNKTSFDDVLLDIEKNFGLVPANRTTSTTDLKLVLTDYEYAKLKDAYEKTMGQISSKYNQEEDILYGSYEPLTVTITHILNNKSGIDFSSYSHTGLPVAVFAKGQGAKCFEGYYNNTDIFHSLANLLGVNK